MVKGAALFLQQGNSAQSQRSLQHPHKHAGDASSYVGILSVPQENLPQQERSRFLGLTAREAGHHGFVMTSLVAGKQRFPVRSLSVNSSACTVRLGQTDQHVAQL